MKINKKLLICLLLITSFILVSVGASYAIFTYTKKGNTVNKITTGIFTFSDKILSDNALITAEPTLTNSSNNTSDASGLYSSTDTNTGNPTYYFRGDVTNNYVDFAGFTWRIIRINEDETVRIIMQDGINDNTTYVFSSTYNNYTYMYYTNSNAKTVLELWYTSNMDSYSDKIATGDYFCEQAKVKYDSSWTSGSASMVVYTSYDPNFKCETDGNGKGVVSSNIGLITYDEVVYAGGYYKTDNSSYYLYDTEYYWTMSPSGVPTTGASAWVMYDKGHIYSNIVFNSRRLRPIINLKADVTVTGSGTSTDPYVVES